MVNRIVPGDPRTAQSVQDRIAEESLAHAREELQRQRPASGVSFILPPQELPPANPSSVGNPKRSHHKKVEK